MIFGSETSTAYQGVRHNRASTSGHFDQVQGRLTKAWHEHLAKEVGRRLTYPEPMQEIWFRLLWITVRTNRCKREPESAHAITVHLAGSNDDWLATLLERQTYGEERLHIARGTVGGQEDWGIGPRC